MLGKIRPRDEELGMVYYMVWFMVIWYGCLIESLLNGKGNLESEGMFLLVGLLPLIMAVNKFYAVIKIRMMRRKIMGKNVYCQGYVVGVESNYYYTSGDSFNQIRHKEYDMIVEYTPRESLQPVRIRSEKYSKPMHKYLKSSEVKVYMSDNGWKHVIGDLQTKIVPSMPDFQLETMPIDEGYRLIPDVVPKVIIGVVGVLFALKFFVN
jgi:hypothetical protein